MLNREEIQDTILNFQEIEKEIKRLRNQLNMTNHLPDSASIVFKTRSHQLQRLERKVYALMELLETTELTDFEFAFIDNLMDGASITKVSRHLGIARKTSYSLLPKIVDKMLASGESNSNTHLNKQ